MDTHPATQAVLTEDQIDNLSSFIIDSLEKPTEEAEENHLLRIMKDYFKS